MFQQMLQAKGIPWYRANCVKDAIYCTMPFDKVTQNIDSHGGDGHADHSGDLFYWIFKWLLIILCLFLLYNGLTAALQARIRQLELQLDEVWGDFQAHLERRECCVKQQKLGPACAICITDEAAIVNIRGKEKKSEMPAACEVFDISHESPRGTVFPGKAYGRYRAWKDYRR